MNPARLILIAAGGSAALLAAALIFERLGWEPCAMCLWQRWPHYAAVVIGAFALVVAGSARSFLAFAGCLAAMTTAGIAAWHTGVERKWWEGPSSCTSGGPGLGGLSAESLVPGGSDVPLLVLCDSFTPFLFGLSMANWNLLASLGLIVIWAAALKRVSS